MRRRCAYGAQRCAGCENAAVRNWCAVAKTRWCAPCPCERVLALIGEGCLSQVDEEYARLARNAENGRIVRDIAVRSERCCCEGWLVLRRQREHAAAHAVVARRLCGRMKRRHNRRHCRSRHLRGSVLSVAEACCCARGGSPGWGHRSCLDAACLRDKRALKAGVREPSPL